MAVTDLSSAIRTERLVLRGPATGDGARVAELANDIDIARMTSRLPHPYYRDDAEAYLAHVDKEDPAAGRAFIIDLKGEGAVGVIGLRTEGGLGPEVGYWIGRPYWGRGLATEAAKAVLSWSRDVWGRRVLISGHLADNPASGRVLVKAGFLYTGEVQPRHSLARDQVAPTRMMVWLA